MTTTIRRARAEDALALAALAESTFRATFAATNSAEDMELHCRESYGEALQAAEIADPALVTLVAEGDGALAGYAQVRWTKTPPCVAARAPGEVARLYVDSAWHGRGVAQQLMAACLDQFRVHGDDTAWLGVWEHNPRAIAFYRKLGFVEAGEQVFVLGRDRQRDLVMVKVVGKYHTDQPDSVARR